MDSLPLLSTRGDSGTPSSPDRDSGCSEKRHQPDRGVRRVSWGTVPALQGCPGLSKSGNETSNQLQVSGAKGVPPVSWLVGLTRSLANMLMRDQINLVKLGFISQGRSFHWVLWWRGIINKEPARSTNPAEKFSLSGLWGPEHVSGMTQTTSVHVSLEAELRWASQEEGTWCYGHCLRGLLPRGWRSHRGPPTSL